MNAADITRHILATYFNLRIGMGLIAIAFPIGLVIGEQGVLPSISAYYYSEVRDLFVGVMIAFSVSLYLYKGFSHTENFVLNLAGIFAFCVAVFPTSGTTVLGFAFSRAGTVHDVCAILFFVCLAYVAWFRALDTLKLVDDALIRILYTIIYRLLALGMIVCPLLVVVLKLIFQSPATVLFAVEVAAIWIFAFYWLVKTVEISISTNADQRVMQDPTCLFPEA